MNFYKKRCSNTAYEAGNVLFLILIAVALFAALSYAVTQSSRGGGDAQNESVKTQASQIVQYSASVKTAIQRMMLMGGYTYRQVDSQGPGSNNSNCPDDGCRVFSPDHYGVSYVPPKEEWLVPENSNARWGEYRISHFPVDGLGTNQPELVWLLHYVKEPICMEINESLGLTSSGAAVPEQVLYINTLAWYTGATTGGNRLYDTGGVLYGQEIGCFREGANSAFYQVLDIK